MSKMKWIKPWCHVVTFLLMITKVDLNAPECPIDVHMCRPLGNQNQPLVVGGQTSEPHEFPFMVLLTMFYKYNNNYHTQYCGGILVDTDLVLTAAHCIFNAEDSGKSKACRGAYATTGEHNRCYCTEETQYVNTKSVYIHPEFKWSESVISGKYDIALIRLNHSVEINNFTRPLNLSQAFEPSEDDEFFTVVGWGTTSPKNTEQGIGSIELQKVNVTVNAEKCKETKYDEKIQICAYDEGADACAGDSGGPLLVRRGNITTLYGIISKRADLKENCGMTPGIYTRVAAFPEILNKTFSKKEESDGFQHCASTDIKTNAYLCSSLGIALFYRSII